MPETEQRDATLSELVVREAVEKGMETPLRETIVEAVREAEGGKSSAGRRLPLAGALVGIGAAIGYALGTRGTEFASRDVSLESVEPEEVVEGVTGEVESITEEEEPSAESSGSRLRRLVLVLGVVAGIALARRRMRSEEAEEWEPIEEFETIGEETESEEEEEEAEEAEAEAGEAETEEGEEEAEAGAEDEDEE